MYFLLQDLEEIPAVDSFSLVILYKLETYIAMLIVHPRMEALSVIIVWINI